VSDRDPIQLTALSFGKDDRILKRSQFLRLAGNGKRIHVHHFLVTYCENRYDNSRLGITVSKKVGKAVARNRIKRIVREFFRLNRTNLLGHYDLNIVAKKGAADLSSRQVNQALEGLFRKISLDCSE
jgi:ribonuclease P protein component